MPVDRVIPEAWLTKAKVQRVICHWTAGSYHVTPHDRACYHVILCDEQAMGRGTDVRAVRGTRPPAGNDSTQDGDYAAHCRGLNTGSFGLSVACMRDAQPRGPYGDSPLTKLLWERMAQAAAEVLVAYDLELSERTCLFHSEVERVYGKAQAGKWDVDVAPWDPSLTPAEVHAQFRRKVAHYLKTYHGRG